MRSMYSGVSGLRVHQSRMDVIGNNIANVNTAGFKSGRVTFSEVFSQTLQGASGPSDNGNVGGRNPMQIGLGVDIASIDTIMTEGAAQRTDNPLDIKIQGDGFFVVNDGTGNKFTRAGAFRLDNAGTITTPAGLKLMGWKANKSSGEIQQGKVEPLTILDAGDLYSPADATTNIQLNGNIDQTDDQLADGRTITSSFYDDLGYKYSAEYKIKEKANPANGEYDIELVAVRDENEKEIDITAIDLKVEGTAGTGDYTNDPDTTAAKAPIVFDTMTGKIKTSASATFSLQGLDAIIPSLPKDIVFDFSEMTMYAGGSDPECIRGDAEGRGAGRTAGKMDSFSIGSDGKIVGKYTNGETKLLGQVVIADFRNPAGLEKMGNNVFEATQNSGDFDGIGQDVTANGGGFNSGVLEMSNVDLSKEFTDMIINQRGFQANSRIITASDEMLQELVNLKR